MRQISILLLGAMMLVAVFMCAAVAQVAGVGVATYLEIMPQSKGAVVVLLKTEAAASRKDDGCEGVQLLQEIGQDNRFVILESWKDQNAFEARGRAVHAQQFRDRLAAMVIAPPDERLLADLWQGAMLKTPSTDFIWAVTHVDVMPSYQDEAFGLLTRLGEGSAKERGGLRFAVARQAGRPNHFTLSEVWADRISFEAHQADAKTIQFRDRLGPMLGALYDQRLYRAVE
jgi:quinol monooxygenase YgiN